MLNKIDFIKTAMVVAFTVTSFSAVAADCKDVPVPDGQAGIHYNRPDGKYDDWGVHLWKSPNIGITNWFIPRMPTGCDSFGVYWHFPLSK
ncbi:MAG TPA: pullulanase-associated domain-containing protein, partial [Methylococcales bacterium]